MSIQTDYEVINFNDGHLVAMVYGKTGVVPITVLNGAWDGFLDWDNLIIWPKLYPDTKVTVKSWRLAMRGEDDYY